MRSAEVWPTERAWLTQGPNGLDAAWVALVRAVADAHGGSARVRSVLGEGGEFEITLPAG